VNYPGSFKDTILSFSHNLDTENIINPRLSNGALSLLYTRKWNGGSLSAMFEPGKKTVFDWYDVTDSGLWKTKFEVPATSSSYKISLAREWKL